MRSLLRNRSREKSEEGEGGLRKANLRGNEMSKGEGGSWGSGESFAVDVCSPFS